MQSAPDDSIENDNFDEFSSENFEDELFASDNDEHAKSHRSRFLFVGVLLALIAGIAYLLFDGFNSETYFYTVDQAVAKQSSIVGKTVRVKGLVEPGSVKGKGGELNREFRITEKGKSIKVVYNKAMPDTFKENMDVVVKGTVDSSMVLVADEVMVKCPSRYEGQPPGKHPSNIPIK